MILRLASAHTLAALALGLLCVSAEASETRTLPKAVVELFTSQGCSSCPPADKILTELSAKPDVIALSYHVDYWDYAGWPDTLGTTANTERQRNYAASWHNNRIYTPQLVVNGEMGVVGSRRDAVQKAIAGSGLDLEVELKTRGDMLEVTVPGKAGFGNAVVWLINYTNEVNVAIERGENSGKTITYSNVVTQRRAIGMWEAAMGSHIKLPLSEVLVNDGAGAAIIIQAETDDLPGPILGAAAYEQ